jgi:hypothetical protein
MNHSDPEMLDSPPQRGSLVTLPLLFVAGWIIYEVTHNPGMAAMAMCLKFGWEDFRTARWLNRSDPDRERGRACSWLYIASGLWQVAIIGVAMVVITIALDELIQLGQQKPADMLNLLQGAVVAVLFGFVFSTVSTYIAMLCARRHGVRPWLNGAVHIARRHEHWPPLYGQRNRAMVLVATTLVITFVILVPVCLVIGAMLLQPILPRNVLTGLGVLLPLTIYFIMLPASIVFIVQLNRQRFFARHPADCWGEEPLSGAKQEADQDGTV